MFSWFTWMLRKNGRSLSEHSHGATRMLYKSERSRCDVTMLSHGCLAKTEGAFLDIIMDALQKRLFFVDVVMVATWMLCKNGRSLSRRCHSCHMDALQKRTESVLDVNMVATWLLFCQKPIMPVHCHKNIPERVQLRR